MRNLNRKKRSPSFRERRGVYTHCPAGGDRDPDEPACCDDPDVTTTSDGMRVCRSCATCFGPEIVGNERRAYTPQEIRDRRTKEPRYRDFGSRTFIDPKSRDARGRRLTGEKKAIYSRLSKVQRSLINSLERNYWEAKPQLRQLSRRMNAPDYIHETAWRIYRAVAQQKLTMGRSIEGFVTAALYAAFRIHDFPRLLEEVVDVAMVPRRTVHRSLALIVRHVLPKLGLKYKPLKPEHIVYRFGTDLDLPLFTQKKAETLIKRARHGGLRVQGKDPKGLAAAALYMAAKPTAQKKTQVEVASVAHVTEVTLRTQAKAIRKHT